LSDDRSGSAEPLEEAASARAKHLPLFSSAPDLVPARMVNEVLYCERLMYLEWVQGEFTDNHYTVEGRAVVHQRVDEKAQPPAAPDDERPWKARSVWLTSERLGLTAKIDIVEADGAGCVAPVEYKRGRPPPRPEGAWLPERAQLCAQVLLLREHGYRSQEAWIWYAGSREKVAITIDAILERITLDAVARARELVASGVLPPPLDNSPKCKGCSLAGICLPDEIRLLREDPTGEVEPAPSTRPPSSQPTHVRRLYPGNDDRSALYVQEQGAHIGVRAQRLQIVSPDGQKSEARIPNTSQVCVCSVTCSSRRRRCARS
jgi:CRISPR-associated protein Cas1